MLIFERFFALESSTFHVAKIGFFGLGGLIKLIILTTKMMETFTTAFILYLILDDNRDNLGQQSLIIICLNLKHKSIFPLRQIVEMHYHIGRLLDISSLRSSSYNLMMSLTHCCASVFVRIGFPTRMSMR